MSLLERVDVFASVALELFSINCVWPAALMCLDQERLACSIPVSRLHEWKGSSVTVCNVRSLLDRSVFMAWQSILDGFKDSIVLCFNSFFVSLQSRRSFLSLVVPTSSCRALR